MATFDEFYASLDPDIGVRGKQFEKFVKWFLNALIEKESDYDNDGLDPSEEYFRKKKKGNDDGTYFPQEESKPPHY